MTNFYREKDADPAALSGLTVTVLGYGNLGRSVAENLRDSGVAVVVGNRHDEYRRVAESDGFRTLDVGDATAAADLCYVLLPDEVIPECFRTEIGRSLRPGAAVCFASGYVLAYGLVEPPRELDVLLLAPRMLGEEVRRRYEASDGYWSYLSVEQDATGQGWGRLLGLAAAIGALRRGALELRAQQEALLDLFVEQSVGAVLGMALMLGFEVGVAAGLPPEAMVVELYQSGEMARTFQTFADQGFLASVGGHGLTASFGGFLSTLAIDRDAMERHFRQTLAGIQHGDFAARFQQEQENGYPTLTAIRAITADDNPMTLAERRVRGAVD